MRSLTSRAAIVRSFESPGTPRGRHRYGLRDAQNAFDRNLVPLGPDYLWARRSQRQTRTLNFSTPRKAINLLESTLKKYGQRDIPPPRRFVYYCQVGSCATIGVETISKGEKESICEVLSIERHGNGAREKTTGVLVLHVRLYKRLTNERARGVRR